MPNKQCTTLLHNKKQHEYVNCYLCRNDGACFSIVNKQWEKYSNYHNCFYMESFLEEMSVECVRVTKDWLY